VDERVSLEGLERRLELEGVLVTPAVGDVFENRGHMDGLGVDWPPIRAASRVPSLSGIQTGSRRSTDRGKVATVVTTPHYTGLSLKSRLTDGRDRSYAGPADSTRGGA
jgi:hypothetical protein